MSFASLAAKQATVPTNTHSGMLSQPSSSAPSPAISPSMASSQGRMAWRTPAVVIAVGCLIAMTGFGIRSVMGLFLEPMTLDRGWDRETFALAMAIQNLLWGIGVPIAGAIADRFGPARVIALGSLIYAAGVYAMAVTEGAFMFQLTGGVLVGLGVAFTSFSLALAAMARVVGPERRAFAFGLGTAAGSLGQVMFSPVSNALIENYGWEGTLITVGLTALVLFPLAFVLPGGKASGPAVPQASQTLRQALREATSNRSFVLLTSGFFVCGFHVAFIAVHFPAYVTDIGLDASVGAHALALVGLFNIAGSLGAGYIGQHYSMKNALSGIYLARAVVIGCLLLAPVSAVTIYVFAAAMGILWLSTVPLTTNIVAQVFGVRYLGTLFGIVFFCHQIGSFLGVWLGGWAYDTYGNYDLVWYLGIGFGLMAAVLHLPIHEEPLQRSVLAPA